MYIHKILIENIRGFQRLEFNLDRGVREYAGWTVFTGDNGSGKSTLLRALVKPGAAQGLLWTSRSWRRAGEVDASVELELARVEPDDPGNGPRQWTREIQIHDQEMLGFSYSGSEDPGFGCGYGPFRRLFGASVEANQQMVSPETERYVTMFGEAASLAEADAWLRQLQYKALEGNREARESLDLVLAILRDDLVPNEIKVDRVNSDGLWLRDRNGVELSWSEMSDGYRSTVALLADILRHLIKFYGASGLTERGADGRLVVTRSGVVMIDEVDAHLHPEWQREIGFWLKRHFPRIQFLVTTHSPIICQAADPNGLFVLPEPGSAEAPRALTKEEYQTVIAGRPDTILRTPAFNLPNTRSDRAVDARAAYSKLRSKERSGAKLSGAEKKDLKETALFVLEDEEV